MKIALTFDIERDIPNFLNTYYGIEIGLMKILKILDDFNLKATFFCTGNVVKHLPELIKSIDQKEHEIACHGLNHERLTRLNFKECEKVIKQNKKIIEDLCQNSEIIGFRAPYLKPPKFLFKILNNLGFRYDSSLNSYKKLNYYQIDNYTIQEFPPSNLNILFRIPMSYSFLRKWIFKKSLIILYFHPWEAINMKKLMFNQINASNIFKNIFIRPDRWINTGNIFISKIRNFISYSLIKGAEFITLKQLLIEIDKSSISNKASMEY